MLFLQVCGTMLRIQDIRHIEVLRLLAGIALSAETSGGYSSIEPATTNSRVSLLKVCHVSYSGEPHTAAKHAQSLAIRSVAVQPTSSQGLMQWIRCALRFSANDDLGTVEPLLDMLMSVLDGEGPEVRSMLLPVVLGSVDEFVRYAQFMTSSGLQSPLSTRPWTSIHLLTMSLSSAGHDLPWAWPAEFRAIWPI